VGRFFVNRYFGKLARTVQSECYLLKGAKESFYYWSRKALHRAHERKFNALRFIPDALPGCYVDVGANHGQSIESIKIGKPGARIYSFEANRMLSERLQARYRDRDDITVLPYGLAEKADTRPLYIPVYKRYVYDGLASFDWQSAAGWLSPASLFWFAPRKLQIVETACETQRLDDQMLQPIFIKIDVQGFQYQVVQGGIETIKRHDPVLLIEDFGGTRRLSGLLGRLGFEFNDFDDSGFYRTSFSGNSNSILMTPERARTVIRSTAAPREREQRKVAG
jgi:FkbM family methyltransferase